MKKFLFSFSIFLATGLLMALNAQDGGAKRYVLFEHYTNASCGPCATQNPVFEAFYEEHLIDARHIEFHTSWPGVDPMHDLVVSEVQAMVDYHGVTGVPDMFANGGDAGGPASVNVDMLNAGTSPIRILVTEEDVDNTRNVTVEIQSVQEVPAGDYFIRVGINEKHINYATPPGNNGESYFGDVFRGWAANEIAYTPAAVGESVTLSYSYDMNAAWNVEEIYTMAYVVNSANKEILNTGTPFDVQVEYLNASADIQASDDGGNSFSSSIYNASAESQSIEVSLTSDQPDDWAASFDINGNTYTDMATIDAAVGASDIVLNVAAGATAGIGRYSITVQPVGTEDAQVLSYIVIHGVTDIIAYNSYPDVDIITPYVDGLAYADNTSYAAISSGELKRAFDNEALSSMYNLYLSIGWTFPPLTDALTTDIIEFLDNGGNLLIAGQDIGWAIDDPNYGTPIQQAFYADYLHAIYNGDGSTSSNAFSIVESDAVFGALGGSSILNVYGGANLYPDHLSPTNDEAQVILTYNNDGGGGAIRTETDTYKVIYFGIGLEHVGDLEVRNELMKTSHDWFYGIVGTNDLDNFISNVALDQNSPNPADRSTEIAIDGSLEGDAMISIVDLTGKVVFSQEIAAGDKMISLNTSNLSEGVYFYYLTNSEGQTVAKKMTVSH
jgi:hypothetical protein